MRNERAHSVMWVTRQQSIIGMEAAYGVRCLRIHQVQSVETLLAPELQEARKRRRNWLATVVVVCACACVVALEYRPLYGWVQGVRSRRMAAKAEAEILAGNFEEAMNKARTAEQTKPDEPAGIRIRARTLGLWRQPSASAAAVHFWKKLEQVGAMQPPDRRSYAEDLLMSGAVADSGNEIEKMLKDDTSDGTLLRLAARWAATEGNAEKARDFAAKAVKLEPDNQSGILLNALLQLSSGKDALRETGIQSMLELGKEPTREGLDALTQLGMLRGIPLDVAGKVMPLLRQHPLANEQHRILAFSIDLALHPDQSAEMLDAAVQKYRTAEPSARCAFGMWLHSRGDNERILAAIPVGEAFKRQDLLRVCLNALAGLKRWGEIERVLEMKDVPLYPAIKELYLARSAEELGSKTVAELHWRRAHLAAGPSPEMMKEIADYAEKCGQFEQAELAFRSLTSNSNTARAAFEGLLRIAGSTGDTAMLCDTLAKMRARWPQDDSVKNDLAYFNLLLGKSVDESMAAAKELIARSPRSLPHLTTLALAAIRKDDAHAALAVYEGFQIPWERIATAQRAIHAAALGVNGKTAEARAEADALNWDELRPEERKLIQGWRTK